MDTKTLIRLSFTTLGVKYTQVVTCLQDVLINKKARKNFVELKHNTLGRA